MQLIITQTGVKTVKPTRKAKLRENLLFVAIIVGLVTFMVGAGIYGENSRHERAAAEHHRTK